LNNFKIKLDGLGSLR